MAAQTAAKDDDVFDLTDLIEKGNVPARDTGQASSEAGIGGVEESAAGQSDGDIDNLLEQMTAGDQGVAGRGEDANGQASSYVVDPNEKLDMSGMGDEDAIFDNLGDFGMSSPPKEEVVPEGGQAASSAQPADGVTNIDDLLAVGNGLASADSAKAGGETAQQKPSADAATAPPPETVRPNAAISQDVDAFWAAVDGAIRPSETPSEGVAAPGSPSVEADTSQTQPTSPPPQSAAQPVAGSSLETASATEVAAPAAESDAMGSPAQESMGTAVPDNAPGEAESVESAMSAAAGLSLDDLDALLGQTETEPAPAATGEAAAQSPPAAPDPLPPSPQASGIPADLSLDDLDVLLGQTEAPGQPVPAEPDPAQTSPSTISTEDLDALLGQAQSPPAPAPASQAMEQMPPVVVDAAPFPQPVPPAASASPSTEELGALLAQSAAHDPGGTDADKASELPVVTDAELDAMLAQTEETAIGQFGLESPGAVSQQGELPPGPDAAGIFQLDSPIRMTELLARLEACETALSVAQDRIVELETLHSQPPLTLDAVMAAILQEGSPVLSHIEELMEELGVQLADRIEEAVQPIEARLLSLEAKETQRAGADDREELKGLVQHAEERMEALECMLEEKGPVMSSVADLIAASAQRVQNGTESSVRDVEAQLQAVRETLTGLEPRLMDNLEKAAAGAAAKVLREEIAAMLAE